MNKLQFILTFTDAEQIIVETPFAYKHIKTKTLLIRKVFNFLDDDEIEKLIKISACIYSSKENAELITNGVPAWYKECQGKIYFND